MRGRVDWVVVLAVSLYLLVLAALGLALSEKRMAGLVVLVGTVSLLVGAVGYRLRHRRTRR